MKPFFKINGRESLASLNYILCRTKAWLGCFCVFIFLGMSVAPQAHAQNTDSIKAFNKERQRVLDSTKAARKVITDSLATIRKYKESKRYKDSVERARNTRLDSIKTARQRVTDSARDARAHILDSVKAVRSFLADSIKQARQNRLDSLQAIRKHKESKFYKDSVAKARQSRLDSITSVRKAFTDSITKERTARLDSVKKVRKAYSDSVAAVRKIRTDSLEARRKYRASKRYEDSVAIIKQNRLDSIRVVRKAFNDSVAAVRKQSLDSANAVRKAFNDSLAAVRKVRMDSLAERKKLRLDSLAKKADIKEKMAAAKQKEIEDKSKLKFELKLAKKRSAWSNEKMLKKKWSIPRQVVQNTFTRYNYYFNAQNKMYEAQKNMLRAANDNYDSVIALFPFDPDRDSTKLLADMDSIIQKASLGIQIHDPRTKWGDDLYLLLGQAYYYKGNYKDALAAFRYVVSMRQQRLAAELKKNASKMSREERLAKATLLEQNDKSWLDFFKHQSVHNDAILWMARTNTEMHKEREAESIIDLIEIDKNVDEQLNARIALEKAYMYLNLGAFKSAQHQLDSVIIEKSFPMWLRQRATFLNAQLNEQQGNYKRAYELYAQVNDLDPNADLQFYASKNAAYNLLKTGGNYQDAIASMKTLLKDGKFEKYNDQIYFVLGKLSQTNQQKEEAIAFYTKGVELPKATRRNKAIIFASLGEIYYEAGDYKLAKRAYDSASTYSRQAQDNADVQLAIKRSKLVDKIVVPFETINANDSLLALSEKDKKQQQSVARDHIRDLRKQLQQQKIADANAAGLPELGNNNSAGASWYFSTPSNFLQGSNDFKRKFGDRPLTDNWRRMAAIGFVSNNTNASNSSSNENENESKDFDDDGLPTEEYLLAQIPKTEEEKNNLLEANQRAYVDLGKAYITELEEHTKGLEKFVELNNKYPNHQYHDEVAYWRYTSYLQQNKLNDAQQQVNVLLQSYPNSRWAKLVAPQNQTTESAVTTPVETYYQDAYNKVIERKYEESLKQARMSYSIYKEPDFQKRFQIIEGISLAGTGKFGEADTLMRDFIKKNNNDTLTRWADAVIRFIGEKKMEDSVLNASKAATLADSSKIANNTTISKDMNIKPPALDSVKAAASYYNFNPSAEHQLIIGFTVFDGRMNALQAGIKDYNLLNYKNENLAANILYFSAVDAVIAVNKFSNYSTAQAYEKALRSQSILFREFKTSEYKIYFISSDNLKILVQNKNLNDYLRFYLKNYKR